MFPELPADAHITLGHALKEIADCLGIHYTTVSKIVSGIRKNWFFKTCPQGFVRKNWFFKTCPQRFVNSKFFSSWPRVCFSDTSLLRWIYYGYPASYGAAARISWPWRAKIKEYSSRDWRIFFSHNCRQMHDICHPVDLTINNSCGMPIALDNA